MGSRDSGEPDGSGGFAYTSPVRQIDDEPPEAVEQLLRE